MGRASVFTMAKKDLGTTGDVRRMGYILPDGSALDLGEEGHVYRSLDHRIVERYYPDLQSTDAMVRFMNDGAIRVSTQPESGYIYLDFIKKPTSSQKSALRDVLGQFDEALVETTSPQGHVEVWREWGKPGGARYNKNAIIHWMSERGLNSLKGLGKVKKSNPKKWMIDAYEAGRRTSDRTIEEIVYENLAPEVDFDDYESNVFFEAGHRGLEFPRFVCGWRYGDIPEGGRSRDYREGEAEAGVSVMAIEGEEPVRSLSVFGVEHRPKVRVCGWLHPYKVGGDGEPLIIEAEKIDNGGLGKVRAPHLTENIFYRTCKEIGQDYQAYEPYDSAFILPDGCFVKLDSHENIASYYPDEIMDTFQREYQAVEDYVERGAIRTHWDGDLNAISFEFHKKPTATQQRIVREMSSWADQVYIDAKQEGPRKGIIAFDVIPILSKRDAGQVVRFMNEKGFGQALGPAGGSCGAGITWQRVTDSIGELRRLYTGFPLPGKPKVKKKCAWALEAALGKFDEALSYRARGECGQAQEHTLDAIRYHGVFLGCQSKKEKKRKKRKKKR